MIQIKPISTLSFVVLLTSWVHFTSSQPPPTRGDFINGLRLVINASPPDVLPFSLKARVIQDWLLTSNEFKDLCLQCESQLRNHDGYTPVMALTEAINRTFHHYIYGANTNFLVLEPIKAGDPIGFNAYLTHNNLTILSQDFMQHAVQFQATMIQRVHLLNMKTNDSCFYTFAGSGSSTPQNSFSPNSIPSIVRNEFATEYESISVNSMDFAIEILSEKTFIRMYSVGTSVANYQTHVGSADDVQIIHGTMPADDDDTTVRVLRHVICIRYRAYSGKVHVYGKMKSVKLDERHQAIIRKLYPFSGKPIIEKRTTFNEKHPASAILAIMYATMLLLVESPALNPLKLNKVWGDETLYMRIHILNMLANRQIVSMN